MHNFKCLFKREDNTIKEIIIPRQWAFKNTAIALKEDYSNLEWVSPKKFPSRLWNFIGRVEGTEEEPLQDENYQIVYWYPWDY